MPIWFYAIVPAIVATLGSAWTALRRPSDTVIGAIQHFAAGVVFYAAAGEILPNVTHGGAAWTIVVGGGTGIALLLLLRKLTAGIKQAPAGMIAASALDALIDGIVLGLGFAMGRREGVLLAIALAVEFLFLGLSIAGAFKGTVHPGRVIATSVGISLAVPLGVLVAQPIGSASGSWQRVAFTFGLIVLLYLVTEELLTEAHEKPETSWATAAFFVGFLAMMVISQKI